jgi:hypothetical protein
MDAIYDGTGATPVRPFKQYSQRVTVVARVFLALFQEETRSKMSDTMMQIVTPSHLAQIESKAPKMDVSDAKNPDIFSQIPRTDKLKGGEEITNSPPRSHSPPKQDFVGVVDQYCQVWCGDLEYHSGDSD